ncbi:MULTISPECIES: DUF3310 domain-containing protein [Anaerococcus]|uniref:DUF3310 domain-containing protein n=1 Tax=Anaerococcus TaxID=165779 RepID=UPI0024309FC1|nr:MULTISPECIES: DUF3310 domain-containing protein [Anaerococcus]MDD7767051.1 DUF3310 domain-containing protein [Anaerococcus vaginalis]MDY6127020.1 DUF3310 domain-containing protein [Anaerococcus sp.]
MKEIRPDYYKSNGVETIDVIEAFDLNFNLGNVIKYVLRAGKKEGEEKEKDLNKAMFYLKREVSKDEF